MHEIDFIFELIDRTQKAINREDIKKDKKMNKKEEQDKILEEADRINSRDGGPGNQEELDILVIADNIRRSRKKYEVLKENNRLKGQEQKMLKSFWKQGPLEKHISEICINTEYTLYVGMLMYQESEEIDYSLVLHNNEDEYDEEKRNTLLAKRMLFWTEKEWHTFSIEYEQGFRMCPSYAIALAKSYITMQILTGKWKEQTPLVREIIRDPWQLIVTTDEFVL